MGKACWDSWGPGGARVPARKVAGYREKNKQQKKIKKRSGAGARMVFRPKKCPKLNRQRIQPMADLSGESAKSGLGG